MEQIRKALSPPRHDGRSSGSPQKPARKHTLRDSTEYMSFVSGGPTIRNNIQTPTVPNRRSAQGPGPGPGPSQQIPAAAQQQNYPQLVPSMQQTADVSPTHSRPGSISMSVAHPQVYTNAPNDQPSQWRRASSFTSPFNPYRPSPVAGPTLQILTLLVHLGILIVLGILLSDLRKTTATFHTLSNNGTGSYLRVGIYGGGLGSVNRPFYVGGVGNSTITTVTVTVTGSTTSLSTTSA